MTLRCPPHGYNRMFRGSNSFILVHRFGYKPNTESPFGDYDLAVDFARHNEMHLL